MSRRKSLTRIECLLKLGCLTVVILATSSRADEQTIISPDRPAPAIYIADKESPAEKFAAQELQTYIRRITGRAVRVFRWGPGERSRMPADRKVPQGFFIAVGNSELTAAIPQSTLGKEQYIVDLNRDRLAIVGGRERGVIYGVYELLESMGVRWYRPEPWGEHVPKSDTIRLPLGRRVSSPPDYEFRSTLAGGFQRYRQPTVSQTDQASLWSLRQRLNYDVNGDRRFGGRMSPRFDHIYYQLVRVEDYFDEHPEYFCLYKGERRKINPDGGAHAGNPTGLQLCLSNPGLQDLFAQKVIAQAKGRRDLDSVTFSISPNDGSPFCECDHCRSMDDSSDPESMSNRVCAFSNIIARKVAEAVPGARLSLQAYSAWTKPPTVVDHIEPNIVLHTCLINQWANYTTPWNSEAPDWNAETRRTIAAWKRLGVSTIYSYEYWSGYGWQGPLPLVRTMADRLRAYRDFNIRGVYNESHPHWGPQGLELYMCAKLLWNPDLDVDAELDLYYRNYYGPAAAAMKDYHEALMDALRDHPYPVHSGGRGMHLVFRSALIERLRRAIDLARKKVDGHSLYERRLHGVVAGFEFAKRVHAILQLKRRTGTEVEMPGWPGRGYYLKSPQADDAFDELLRWVRTYSTGDAVFDIAPNPPHLSYVREDVLQNAPLGFLGRESLLLKDF